MMIVVNIKKERTNITETPDTFATIVSFTLQKCPIPKTEFYNKNSIKRCFS